MKHSLLLARLILLFYCLAILAGSSIPSDQMPKGFQLTPDKLIHFVEYFILGVLLYRWLLIEFNFSKIYSLILITLLIGSAFGALDENYQRLTRGRSPDIWDWVLDSIGVLFAVIVGYFSWPKK